MPASTEAFRAALRRFATGVTIVTTAHEGRVHGFTVNAFASVTAEPPTVLVCVNRSARAHPLIAAAQHFCVNILALEQRDVAERFALAEPHERFAGLDYSLGETGSPIITGSLAHLDCIVSEEHTTGTHTIFLGTVVGSGARDGSPLGYYDRAYRDFGVTAG